MSIEAMKQSLEALQHAVPKDTKQAREQFDAIQALRTAIQQAEAKTDEPVDGPTTYQQRFTEVVSLLCRAAPPADMVEGWLTPDADDNRLQEWAIEHAPNWSQGIGVLDAAHVMADQPAEGEGHETLYTHPAPGVPEFSRIAIQQAESEPVLFVSPEQARAVTGKNRVHYTPSDNSGRYLPVRATPAGLFTQPLYTHPVPGQPDALNLLKSLGPKPWETSPEAHAQARLISDFADALTAAQAQKG